MSWCCWEARAATSRRRVVSWARIAVELESGGTGIIGVCDVSATRMLCVGGVLGCAVSMVDRLTIAQQRAGASLVGTLPKAQQQQCMACLRVCFVAIAATTITHIPGKLGRNTKRQP